MGDGRVEISGDDVDVIKRPIEVDTKTYHFNKLPLSPAAQPRVLVP